MPRPNVIPATARAGLNIRFNDRHSGASLTAWLQGVAAEESAGTGVRWRSRSVSRARRS